MHRRPDEDFDSFCEALIQTKQKHIVDAYLRPSGLPDAAPEGDWLISVTRTNVIYDFMLSRSTVFRALTMHGGWLS